MGQIERQRTISGKSFPAILKNGRHFFYVDLEVYADGMVNAWELHDLAGFVQRLEKDRLRILTRVPDGTSLSVHHLGSYTIVAGNWLHTSDTILQLVNDTVRELNPDLTNLYQVTEREREWNRVHRRVLSARAMPYRVTHPVTQMTEHGVKQRVFMRRSGATFLVDIIAFTSGTIRIEHSKFDLEMPLAEFEGHWRDDYFRSSLVDATEVDCGTLGLLTLRNGASTVAIEEIYKSIHSAIEKMKGNDRLEACQKSYRHYLEVPTETNRQRLREAYEHVAAHERIYLGDMDTRDTDYRRILYSDEKREV